MRCRLANIPNRRQPVFPVTFRQKAKRVNCALTSGKAITIGNDQIWRHWQRTAWRRGGKTATPVIGRKDLIRRAIILQHVPRLPKKRPIMAFNGKAARDKLRLDGGIAGNPPWFVSAVPRQPCRRNSIGQICQNFGWIAR